MRDRGFEGNPQAIPITIMGIVFVGMGVVVGAEYIIGAALCIMGIANIIISGYVYYDE